MTSYLEKVEVTAASAQDEIKKMWALMHKYSDKGASDSEPVYHFEKIMEMAHEGQMPPFEKMDANWWELYTCSMNCSAAARALTAQAKKVYNAILMSKIAK